MNRWSMTVIGAVIIALVIPFVLMFVNKNEIVKFDDSPLHSEAKRGEFTNVQKAFDAGADINAQDEDGKTALHHAAENGHSLTSKSILALGADLRILDNNGKTALELAQAGNHGQTAGEIERAMGVD